MAARARYYDGKVAVAREVTVRPASHELLITDAADSSVVARWPASELVVLGDTGHEKAPPVARRGEEARLVIEDPELRRQLAQAMPPLAALGRPRPAALPRIALFGVTLAAALGLFWIAVDVGSGYVAPCAVRPAAPAGRERRRGPDRRAAALRGPRRAGGDQRPGQPPGQGGRLPHPVRYDRKGGPVNAFTLPGGILVFYSDLIDLARDGDELAGVLAHEMGHVTHYHAIKGLARQFGVEQLLKSMTGGFSDLGTVGAGGSLLLALRNGRGFERDADATARGAAREARPARRRRFQVLRADAREAAVDMASVIGIWSSHPPTAERIAATRRPATGAPLSAMPNGRRCSRFADPRTRTPAPDGPGEASAPLPPTNGL